MKYFLFIFLFISSALHALEVDEKLTVRVLKSTDTRKTLMLNRGSEDGLVEGDHARFIVTAGVVARGVLVKVSPTRSIWSIYRLVNADFIVNDAVMTIKITPPVKITKDETQTIVAEDTPSRPVGDPNQLGIPLADGAQDISSADANLSVDDAEVMALEDVTIVEKNVEVFTLLNISGLAASTKSDVSESKGSFASHHIGVGAELYSQKERAWYSRFSLTGAFNVMRLNSQSYNGVNSNNDTSEFEFGVNWHPGTMPSQTNRFIPYAHLAGMIGSTKSMYRDDAADTERSANGSTNGFSLGFGFKYYVRSGFGGRILFDYYQRAEKFSEDDAGQSFNRTVGGPRLLLGFSYRF